jgi:acyl carrier protein
MSASHFVQKPVRWLQAISRYRATTSGGPNFAYDLCVRRIDLAQTLGLDLSNWKIAFNGAETVRSDTIRRFSEAFRNCGFRAEAMYPCYGLAEATLFVAGGEKSRLPTTLAVRKDDLGRKQATADPKDEGSERVARLVGCGRSLPGQEIAIVRSQERTPCDPGEIGEIWVSGPSVAQGYYNRVEETEECFHAYLQSGAGPYLRTGDLGFLLGGNLFVTGRLKDLIIIRGTNYYPHDIESTAEGSHASLRPGCSAAFCVDDHGEEGLVVICELEHGHEETARDVISSIRRAISEEHELRTYTVVLVRPGAVPKTPNGKLQRLLCREAYLEGRLTIVRESRLEGHLAQEGATQEWRSCTGERPETLEELERWFLRKLKTHGLGLNQLIPEMHLSELHVDSLIIVALKGEIEDEFGIRIQAAKLFDFPNLGQLAAYILDQCKHRFMPQSNDSRAISTPSGQAGHRAVQGAREGRGRLQSQRLLRNGRAPPP